MDEVCRASRTDGKRAKEKSVPFTTLEEQRAYRRDRKSKLLEEARIHLGRVCVRCGSSQGLQFDHVDPESKLFWITKGTERTSSVFWAEVEKCQLLCKPHHEEKSALERREVSKLRELDVRYIRELYQLKHPQTVIASEFGISQMTVSNIVRRVTWSHVA